MSAIPQSRALRLELDIAWHRRLHKVETSIGHVLLKHDQPLGSIDERAIASWPGAAVRVTLEICP
jgi:hypothetical protein